MCQTSILTNQCLYCTYLRTYLPTCTYILYSTVQYRYLLSAWNLQYILLYIETTYYRYILHTVHIRVPISHPLPVRMASFPPAYVLHSLTYLRHNNFTLLSFSQRSYLPHSLRQFSSNDHEEKSQK
jgi:hypothetical protein